MVLKDIQAILIPEFTIITTYFDKLIISREREDLKFESEKNLKIRENYLGEAHKRKLCRKCRINFEAFYSTQKSGKLNDRAKKKILFLSRK